MPRGHIRSRGKSHQIIYDEPRGPDGKRRQRSETIRGTRRQAQARLTTIQHSLNQGTYLTPSQMTVREYLATWYRDHVETSMAPTSIERMGLFVRIVQSYLGDMTLSALQPFHVQAMYRAELDRGQAGSTVRRMRTAFHGALQIAVRQRILVAHPCDGVTLPRVERADTTMLTPEECGRLLAAAHGSEYGLPIWLALQTGMRRGEVAGLCWDSVDLERRQVTVRRSLLQLGHGCEWGDTKTGRSRRTIAITETVVDLFRGQLVRLETAYRARGILDRPVQVCGRLDGEMMLPTALSQGFQVIRAKAGLTVRFHDLRHTHASILLLNGVPIHVVKERLGHSRIQTTIDTYGHLLPTSDAMAADAVSRVLDGEVGLGFGAYAASVDETAALHVDTMLTLPSEDTSLS